MIKHSKLDKARVRLLVDQPFFGTLLMKKEMVVHEDDTVATACVDKAGRIHFSAKFLEGLSVDETVFILAHEVMHVVYAHLARMGDREHDVWNVACDAVINDLLVKEKVGRMVEGGVNMPGSVDKTAEQVYDELMSQAQQSSPGGASGKQGSTPQGSNSGQGPIIKDLRPEDAEGLSPSDKSQAIAEGKCDIAQTLSGLKIAGKLNGTLAQRFREYLESKVPWHTVLERYMTAHVERHQSWSRPNKRYVGRFYLPRRERMPGMGELVIQIDSSGSVSDKELNEFLGHIKRLIEQCNPTKTHLLLTTTEVEWAKTFERGEEIEPPKESWFGGTDMCAGFEWARENAPDAELIVTFTDGYTPFPDSEEFPSVWVITGEHGDAPIGETVRY